MSHSSSGDRFTEILRRDALAPFFWARKLPDRIESKGIPQCFLGHRLTNGDGIFADWDWDGQRLHIRNDRYGFLPLYYFVSPFEIGVSPSISRLLSLGASSDLDDGAMSVFLRVGYMLGEDTPFKEIRNLPPGADFSWDGELQKRPGGLWTGKRQELGREDALDGYISLFRAAMGKRPPTQEDFVMPLTGGKDSRHIVLELCERGHKIGSCVTMKHFPPRPNDDAEIAAELTALLDLDHIVLPQPETRFEAELRKNIRTNFCSDEHQWSIALADYLIGRTNCIYDGLAGDILTSSNLQTIEHLHLFAACDFETLARKLMRQTESAANVVQGFRYRAMNRELAVEKLSNELKRHANAPNPISSYYFWNRTRREIALIPYCILRDIPTVYTPFLDHDLYDFLSSLPGEMVIGTDFHAAAIKRGYPRFANLRFQDRKTPPCPNFPFYRSFAFQAMRYVLEERSTLLRKSYVVPRLLRCMIDEEYSDSVNWLAPLSIYLLQLEELTGTCLDFPSGYGPVLHD